MLKRYVLFLAVLVVVLLVPQQILAEGQMWGNDVLVHQANHIYGFGIDQGDKDTLLLVVSDSSTTNLMDTLYVYRSTNNGQSWDLVRISISGQDDYRLGKADIITAKGDSSFTFVFRVYHNTLWCARYLYDVSGIAIQRSISGISENVVDFSVCQDLWNNYWLYVVYQTDQDSVIFKTSRDYGQTWKFKKNLTEVTPITSQPTIAWSRGTYLVVAGKTDDDKIYTIRNDNSGYSADWKDGQYPWAGSDCHRPVVAGSHTSPESDAVFWVFYQRWVTDHYILNYHWSTDAGATWSSISSPSDTSSGNRLYPSLHVLKENDASDITLAYRYEIGAEPRQIRYIYKEEAQNHPSVWTPPYSGVNDYSPDYNPPQRAYTIRGTDNSIRSAILYVHWTQQDLYFDASSFTGVDDEIGDEVIREFSLRQNYPNPFNPGTVIEYELAQAGRISMEIYNILGQRVRQLFEGHADRGHHRVTWDGKDDNGAVVANGIYFYRIQVGDFTQTKKMILLK